MDSRHSWLWKRSATPPGSGALKDARAMQRAEVPTTGTSTAAGLQQFLDRVRRRLRSMGRHWRFGLLATLLCAGLLAVPVLRYHERFLSSAVIYQQVYTDPDSIAAGIEAGSDASVLQEMLFEYRRLSSLIDQLGLYSGDLAHLGPAAAVADFRADIVFKPLGKNTFRISFTGDSPQEAQTVTSRLTQTLVDEDRQRRAQQAASGETFFSAEMSRAAVELRAAERELERFVAEHPAYSQALLPDPGAPTIAPRKTADGRPAAAASPPPRLAAAGARPSRAEADGGQPVTSGANAHVVAPDPAMLAERSAASAALAEANSRLAELHQRYTDEHPSVAAALSSVNGASARLEAANAALKRAEPESPPAPGVESPPAPGAEPGQRRARTAARGSAPSAAPHDEIDQGPAVVDSKPQAALDTEWARLARDVGDARKRHERLAEDSFHAQVASRSLKAGYSLGVVVLDEASPPDKPIRSRGLLAVIAAVGALLLGLGLTFGRAVLDDRIFDEADLSPFGVEPILTVIPALTSRSITLHGDRRRGQSPQRA